MSRPPTRVSWLRFLSLPLSLAPSLLLLAVSGPATAGDAPDPRVARGRYLVTVMDCGGCHTPGALAGRPDPARRYAGSEIGFGGSAPMGEMTGGVVYPSNLTPDPETGLGRWSEEEIGRAIRYGQRPDGRTLVPVMPWPSYAQLTDEDLAAIVAYLRSLPPVHFVVPRNAAPGERPAAPFLKVVSGWGEADPGARR